MHIATKKNGWGGIIWAAIKASNALCTVGIGKTQYFLCHGRTDKIVELS